MALRTSELAASVGCKLLLAGEYRLSDPYAYSDPVPLLSRAAAEAPGLDLVTMSLCALHHPVDVAEAVLPLDALHAGRTVVCAALGYRKEEYATFGIDWGCRLDRFEEAVALLEQPFGPENGPLPRTSLRRRSTAMTGATRKPIGPKVWRAANADRAVGRGLGRATWLMASSGALSLLERKP